MDPREKRIAEALRVLADLGMPAAQRNERSALCLLALVGLNARSPWSDCNSPLMGITPIMAWAREHFAKEYAPNTRETFRRQTMHQFVQGGVALYNPDKPDRPVNSPHAVYQIEPTCLTVLRSFGTDGYAQLMEAYKRSRLGLAQRYAMHREMEKVPLQVAQGTEIRLSPGEHSQLIRAIWEEFGPRFIPNGQLVYAGDTGDKWGYFDSALLTRLGVAIDNHGKMPDVVVYEPAQNWLVLVEAVTSHGPVDAKRHTELKALFAGSTAGLVFVSAFPDRRTFARFNDQISWETDVWVADNPTHLIHFNGTRFLGPYT